MKEKLTQVAESMQKVLKDEAVKAGKESGYVKRESKLSGDIFTQTLVFGWMANPKASLEQLSQTAAALGVEVSAQAIDQRFTRDASECLRLVLQAAIKAAISADKVALPLLERFNGCYIFDTTSLSLPEELIGLWRGNGNQIGPNAAMKLEVSFDYSTGKIAGPFLEQGRARDFNISLQQVALPKGALRLADLAYFSMELFKQYNSDGIYWLSRLQPLFGMLDDKGNHFQIVNFLAQQSTNLIDMPISLGTTDKLACRLLALRVPLQVAEQRKRKLHESCRRLGKTASQEQLTMTEWTVFATNIPLELMTPCEALILAKVRWQIELLFKLWKSHGEIDQSLSKKPWRILCEIYAKLLALIVQHWIIITCCWQYPNRSLFKAAQSIRHMARAIAITFNHSRHLANVLASIERCLSRGCRINKRRAKPNIFSLLADLAQLNFL